MKTFIDLTPAQRDMTRIYWNLMVDGPKTMPELRKEINWTTYRLNQRLYQLQKAGCVRLVERGRHYSRNGQGANWCGKWEAIPAPTADISTVHG